MGGRITIDSATLMNKGLEVIEAHHLFGVAYERIDVVVHPQSIVHSLIELNDGAQLAHLGLPDMRVPISYALHLPERADVTVPALDLAAVGELELRARPTWRPSRACAWRARRASPGARRRASLNAADEVAVAAFLDGGSRSPRSRGDRGRARRARRRSRSPTSRSCSSATRGARELAGGLGRERRLRDA